MQSPIRALALILVGLLSCFDGSPAVADDAPQVASTHALFRTFDEGSQPGAAVLVMRSGEVVFSRGYGLADLETGARITPTARFRLASVSKQFTAMAVARLAEAGRLGLDDPVTRYVPVLATYPGITVRQLLIHTSGLPDYYDVIDTSTWEAAGSMPSNADVIAYTAAMQAPLFAPGERYEYSNPGYEVLPLVIEAVTGEPYADYMGRVFFPSLSMQRSLIHDHRRPPIPDRVIGYTPGADGWARDDENVLNGVTGSGGQYSALEDFVAWEQALSGQGPLSDELLAAVFTPEQLGDGTPIEYGLGWRIDQFRDRLRIAHTGSWVGFRNVIVRLPEAGLTIVILSNRGEGYEPADVADEVAGIWWPDLSPAPGS